MLTYISIDYNGWYIKGIDMRLTVEVAREALDQIMLAKDLSVNAMAQEIGISRITLNKFINSDALPQTKTYLRMLDYIETNKARLKR